MAASMTSQRPIKGILKNKTSASFPVVASAEQPRLTFKELNKKSQKWDEVNIFSTYHLSGKDYRLMKTTVPNTLYRNSMAYDEDTDSNSECYEMMNPDLLQKKFDVDEDSGASDMDLEEEGSGDEENYLSPQELEKKRQFEIKRKLYSKEGLNIKLARLLISKDLHDDDDDDRMSETEDFDSIDINE